VISRMQRAEYQQRMEAAVEVLQQASGNAPGDVVRDAAATLPAA
jgi:hypothetical protein